MGSVRKLAMFVVIGLVAVSTAITVYTANESNRRETATTSQETLAIQRGTSLYITYCLSCHGPAGLGSAEPNADGSGFMGRTGLPLNQSVYTEEELADQKAIFQSDDPVLQTQAEDFIRFRIMYGAPSEGQLYKNYDQAPSMPAFRHDLNVEQLNDLVYLITHGNWNYVYNESLHQTGVAMCNETPEAERTGMCEGDMTDAYAYPTVAPAD